jgi:hypothetical protein
MDRSKVSRRLVQAVRGMLAGAALLGVLAGATGVQAAGEPTVFALTTGNQLLSFNEARPDRILSSTSINGLQSSERVLGMDFRPVDRQLYAVTSANRLLIVDTATGNTRQLGPTFAVTLDFDQEIGVDFNPQVDRIRVVTDKGQNLRLVPDTGMANAGTVVDGDPNTAGVQPDGRLQYNLNPRDRNAGRQPNVVAAAYTNNVPMAPATILYVIDSDLDVLATQNPPNAGTLNTVGGLKLNASDLVGFDIFTDEDGDNARAAIQRGGDSSSRFYTVDLSSGRAKMKDKGKIGGGGVLVRDIAIAFPTP